MNLVVLQYYTAVCELGSMAKAAERLSLSRQALSKAILTLEREVGIKLLRRKKSGTEPTPAGHILYRHAHVLLRNWDKALEELEPLKREQRSVLRVGYGQMTYNLWPAGHAEAFAQAHPEVQFSYEILPPEKLLSRLSAGLLDLIISGERGEPETTFSVLLQKSPTYLLLRQEDPLAQKEEILLSDLARHPILLNASSRLSEDIQRCFHAEGVEAEFLPFPSHDPLTLLRTIRSSGAAYFDTRLHFLYTNLMDGLAALPFRHDGPHSFPSWDILATAPQEHQDNPILRQYIHYLTAQQALGPSL